MFTVRLWEKITTIKQSGVQGLSNIWLKATEQFYNKLYTSTIIPVCVFDKDICTTTRHRKGCLIHVFCLFGELARVTVFPQIDRAYTIFNAFIGAQTNLRCSLIKGMVYYCDWALMACMLVKSHVIYNLVVELEEYYTCTCTQGSLLYKFIRLPTTTSHHNLFLHIVICPGVSIELD